MGTIAGQDGREPASPIPPANGEDAAIACTLGTDQVDDRVLEWQRLLRFVRDREALAGGALRLVLDPTTPLDELARLAVAEQGCCAFFAFSITVDARGLGLEVRAPAEAGELVTAVFGERDPTSG